jgi:sortase A
MNRIFSIIGSVLVLAGIALLAYVSISYLRQSSAKPPSWSQTQQRQGRQIAARLRGHQQVAVPRHAAAAPQSEPAVRMVIPRIGVDSRIVQTPPVGGVWNVADWSVGHLSSTPDPGSSGNGAYAAHDDIKGELFKRLAELAPGDEVIIYSAHVRFRYAVVGQQTVDPSNVSVLSQTRTPTVTLITCSPYWVDTYRLVVQATLKSRTAI